MNKLIVANWKMQFTHHESIRWLSENLAELDKALVLAHNKLVICPSFTELCALTQAPNCISWGAQDCSHEERGAFTGDVSATSLKELGCTYVILGHSERRTYYAETDERILSKIKLALQNNLTPIVCIGETSEDHSSGKTYQKLEAQLSHFIDLLKTNPHLYLAYEPVWAIGTGIVPTHEELLSVLSRIRDYVYTNTGLAYPILYGGSVSLETIHKIPLHFIDGLLIGKASTNAEVLKKIILSC